MLMGIYKSLTHKGELKQGGGGVKDDGGGKVEKTYGGFTDLVASRPLNVTVCAERASGLEGTRTKTLSHKLTNSGVHILGKGI
jgi:hypothetical protein